MPVDPVSAGGAGSAAASPSGAGASSPAAAKLHQAAQAFESLFWEEVLRAGLPEGGFVPDSQAGGSLYGGIIESGLADAVSKAGGVGLAQLIERSIASVIAPEKR
jgi:Rod binding domain-containing protein